MKIDEYNKIVEEVGQICIKHFVPAFEILQKEKDRISEEFQHISVIINNNDETLSEIEKRISRLEDRFGMDHKGE
jgi:hypothetical protein